MRTIILLIFSLLLPYLVFGQGENQILKPPATLNEILETLKREGLSTLDFLLKIVKRIWEEFLAFSWLMMNWLKNFWDSYIYPFFYNIWQKTVAKEINERKLIIREGFEEEKKEIKEELKKIIPQKSVKTIWGWFKELIK